MAQRKKGDTQFERLHVRKICMPPDSTSQGVFTSSKGIVTFFILVKISSVNIIGNDEFTNVELSVFRAVFPRYTNAQTYYTNRKIMFPALKAIKHKTGNKNVQVVLQHCCILEGGRGGTQQSFIRGGSALRSNPLIFYVPFLKEKVSLLKNFINKRNNFYIPSKSFSTAATGLSLKYE